MRLEIGGGPHPLRPGYEQFDAIDWSARTGLSYTLGDARALPYRDGSVEEVFASNVLEHFPPGETTAVLTEWARVLIRGGLLRVVVPDSMGILRDHFARINSWADCEERLRGSRDYPGNEHLTCFTLAEFRPVLDAVPTLAVLSVESTHAGGGITATAQKIGG